MLRAPRNRAGTRESTNACRTRRDKPLGHSSEWKLLSKSDMRPQKPEIVHNCAHRLRKRVPQPRQAPEAASSGASTQSICERCPCKKRLGLATLCRSKPLQSRLPTCCSQPSNLKNQQTYETMCRYPSLPQSFHTARMSRSRKL